MNVLVVRKVRAESYKVMPACLGVYLEKPELEIELCRHFFSSGNNILRGVEIVLQVWKEVHVRAREERKITLVPERDVKWRTVFYPSNKQGEKIASILILPTVCVARDVCINSYDLASQCYGHLYEKLSFRDEQTPPISKFS